MLFYICLFLILIYTIAKYPDNKKVGIWWIFFLCFLSMFRAESVGTDTANYTDFSSRISKFVIDYDGDIQIGRMLEISYLSTVMWLYENDYSPRLIIVFMSVITFVFVFLTLKREKISYGVGILIFTVVFYLLSFNIARQICSCTIVLYAYTFLFEKGLKKYIFFLLILFATSIHASSILYLSLYILRYIKSIQLNKNILTLFAVSLFFINIIVPLPLSEWLISTFASLSYSDIYSDRSVTHTRSIFGILYSLLQFIAYILIFIKCNKEKIFIMDFIYYLIIISMILSGTANSDFARIFLPLQIYQIIYITKLHQNNRLNASSFTYFIMINTLLVLYGASTGSGEVVPYLIDLKL